MDEDLEDGELTDSDSSYTPLQRPEATKVTELQDLTRGASGPSNTMEESLDADESVTDFGGSSASSSDSSDAIKRATGSKKKRQTKKANRTVLLRVKPTDQQTEDKQSNQRFKKYNIWTASLQEESLMENMRGFDVAKDSKQDRSVENYDFSLKYRLNGENRLKRRLSNSGDELSDEGYYQQRSKKRSKYGGSMAADQERRSLKDRLGKKSRTSSNESENAPRDILDLVVSLDNEIDDIAKDIANKLCEEKDDLMIRVVQVLGKEVPVELFKETQRIEKDGGMMVMNGIRRRTPGGVFLFLLKHSDTISQEDKKLIFQEETKKSNKDRKMLQAIRRDQKVEELKKRLNQKEKDLPPLTSRAELYSKSHLTPDTNGALSNPPPSPVANSGQENSPEYNSHAINHVNDTSPDKLPSRNPNELEDESLTAYDDDFLDMNCDDMDMF